MDDSWRLRMATSSDNYDAADFSDVFGGPPRTVFGRKYSTSFYKDVFRQQNSGVSENKSGRRLQAFSIPAKSEVFYRDIFANDRIRRPTGNSSSPTIGADVALDSFASKLRPINVPARWNSSTASPYNFQRLASPEFINYDSRRSFRTLSDNLDIDSPSAVSSLCQDWEYKAGFHDEEVMSSYVIEVSSDHYQEGDDDAICEAIAWAKEKFRQQSPGNDRSVSQAKEHNSMQTEEISTAEAKQQSEDDRESRMLDDDTEAELWSSAT